MVITKDNNEAQYVFSWNSGDVVEIHTEQTFREQWEELYGEGTKFDLDYGKLVILFLCIYIAIQVS